MWLYASVIQRLERELKIEVNEFPDLGLCVCDVIEEGNTEEDQDEEEDSNWQSLIRGRIKRYKKQRKTII